MRGSLLIWLDEDMTWLPPHDGRSGRPAVLWDPVLSDDEAPVQAVVAANVWDGAQLAEVGESEPGRAVLYEVVPAVGNTGCPDPLLAGPTAH